MQPKHDLLVFSKKEILVVLVLLILVALFSFTIGLRLGKNLGAKESTVTTPSGDHAPLEEKAADSDEEDSNEEEDDAAKETSQETSHEASSEASHSHGKPQATSDEAKPTAGITGATGATGEGLAEQRLAEEVKKEGIKSNRSITTALPDRKKKASETVGYTLQIGAYKTVNEATEQVAVLKRRGLDKAFYFEAEIPGKGTWYRVGIGVYKTKIDAERAGQHLRAQGEVPSFIVQRIGE